MEAQLSLTINIVTNLGSQGVLIVRPSLVVSHTYLYSILILMLFIAVLIGAIMG